VYISASRLPAAIESFLFFDFASLTRPAASPISSPFPPLNPIIYVGAFCSPPLFFSFSPPTYQEHIKSFELSSSPLARSVSPVRLLPFSYLLVLLWERRNLRFCPMPGPRSPPRRFPSLPGLSFAFPSWPLSRSPWHPLICDFSSVTLLDPPFSHRHTPVACFPLPGIPWTLRSCTVSSIFSQSLVLN